MINNSVATLIWCIWARLEHPDIMVVIIDYYDHDYDHDYDYDYDDDDDDDDDDYYHLV